jgi:NitT/TauT family transport system substrate-binding protein
MRRLRTVVWAVTVLVLAALTACGNADNRAAPGGSEVSVGPSDESSNATEMSIALNPWIGYGPWYVARAKGFDTANGVHLKFVNFVDNKDLYAAIASGRIDSTEALVSTALRFQASKIPLKVALFQDLSKNADAIIGAKGIMSISDLRGKKVAYEEGGGHEMLLRLALEKNDLTLNDIQSVPLSADKAGAALISEQVQAAVTYEPYVSQALQKTAGASIISNAGDFPGIISDVWMVSEKFATDNPKVVTGALAAWNQGVDFFRTHTEEALKIVADVTGVSPQELATTYPGVQLFNGTESLDYLNKDFQPLAQQILSIMKSQSSIDGEANPSTLVDTSYLKAAQ